MIRATRTAHAVAVTLLFSLAVAVPRAVAQAPPAITTGQPAVTTGQTGDRREAPVMRFDPQGIDLVQAVTITLQNAPDIQLAEASATQALGFAQQQIGLFDTNLFADTNYNYQQQLLTPTDFLGEVLKRDNLRTQVADQATTRTRLNSIRDQLNIIRTLPAECGVANVATQLAALRRIDSDTATELELIDALCASANQVDPSQQLRRDLITIRQRVVDDTIARVTTGVTEAQNAETFLQRFVSNLGDAPDQEFFRNSAFKASIARLFRNGLSFTPFFDGTYNVSNFLD